MEHLVRQPMKPVLTLEIDRVGQITRKIMDASREAQLTNSLLRSLYSDIRVATVEVPTEPLDPCEQAMVEQALARLELDGTRYSLVGASGSAKEGRFYAVELSAHVIRPGESAQQQPSGDNPAGPEAVAQPPGVPVREDVLTSIPFHGLILSSTKIYFYEMFLLLTAASFALVAPKNVLCQPHRLGPRQFPPSRRNAAR
ncbi:MAG TPA: hypothetical protein VGQ12_17620 [Candidatus Angelobacter sp.]|nr:hypothetical protein [Candidatus Angelobacter sp.]